MKAAFPANWPKRHRRADIGPAMDSKNPTPDAEVLSAKILSRQALMEHRAKARIAGRKVVQCHGCFDLVHPGHVRHLRFAKAQGDILLVSISGDSLINKGAGRPLIPEELRADNLAALDCVDWVHIDSEPTAKDLLNSVQPDIYVKGREYESNNDPRFQAERQTVEDHGGRVVFSSGDVVFSSTALISAIEHSVDPFHKRLLQLTQTDELQGPELYSLISEFRGKRILIIGETILDTYVVCDRPEVAGESPIMTLRPLERRHYDGGAAILARHVAALGAKPVLITPLPRSPQADAIRRRLVADGVEVHAIPIETALVEKQRFLVGAQKVMKVDLLEPIVLDAAAQDALIDRAGAAARDGGGCHGAIIADFGQGMFTPTTINRLCRELRPLVDIMSGDVSGKRSLLRAMRSMDLLCPSESEMREAYRIFDQGLPAVTWEMLQETRSQAAIVTMGPEGQIGFDRLPNAQDPTGDGWRSRLRSEHVPALCPYAVDPLGCGDSMLATATLALASGGSLLAASFLGATAAATQAQRIGNIPVSSADLRHGITRAHTAQLAFAAADVVDANGIGRATSQKANLASIDAS